MSKGKSTKPAKSKDSWSTPDSFFKMLDKFYNFDFDAAATEENTKVSHSFGGKFNKGFSSDSLKEEWGYRNFLNPPFSRKVEFIERAILEAKHEALTVMLLPASTGAKWFQNAAKEAQEIIFIGGRLTFIGAPTSADFDVVLMIFRPSISAGCKISFLDLPPELRK